MVASAKRYMTAFAAAALIAVAVSACGGGGGGGGPTHDQRRYDAHGCRLVRLDIRLDGRCRHRND